MQILWLVLGIASLLYFVILVSIGMDFSIIWLCGAAVFFGLAFLGHYHKTHPGAHFFPTWCKVILGGVLAVGLFVFLLVEVFIFTGMFQHGEKNLDYVIVLGAQVKGEVPSKALTLRLDAASEYLKENPESKAVLSGGRGPGEDITEAEAMRRYLTAGGIEANRLILEDKSTSTQENLKYSAQLIGSKEDKVGIVTNNFHVFRAIQLGKKQGYTNLSGIAAASDPRFQIHYLVREFFALVKEKLVGNI